jgi:hypothetical protein
MFGELFRQFRQEKCGLGKSNVARAIAQSLFAVWAEFATREIK